MQSLIVLLLLALSSPCFGAFTYYRSITVDHTKVPNTDQSNYAVLVTGTYSYLATVANGGKVQNANGYDVGFYTNSNCSTGKMDWETVIYTATSGLVEYWIRNGTLSHTADTVFYMCYGDSGITTDQSNKTAVWDANYVAVYHHGTSSSLVLTDSTSNALDLTNNGTVTAAAAAINGGASYNGTTQYLSHADAAVLQLAGSITISAWCTPSSFSGFPVIMSKGYGSIRNYELGYKTDGTPRFLFSTASDIFSVAAAGTTVATGALHYIGGVWNGTNLQVYLDGAASGSPLASAAQQTTDGHELHLGNLDATPNAQYLSGTCDESRLSSTARSADWMATNYNNQGSPSTFYTVGAENGGSTNRRIRIIF